MWLQMTVFSPPPPTSTPSNSLPASPRLICPVRLSRLSVSLWLKAAEWPTLACCFGLCEKKKTKNERGGCWACVSRLYVILRCKSCRAINLFLCLFLKPFVITYNILYAALEAAAQIQIDSFERILVSRIKLPPLHLSSSDCASAPDLVWPQSRYLALPCFQFSDLECKWWQFLFSPHDNSDVKIYLTQVIGISLRH